MRIGRGGKAVGRNETEARGAIVIITLTAAVLRDPYPNSSRFRQVFADDSRFTIITLDGDGKLITNPANFKTATEVKQAVEDAGHPDSMTSVEFAGKAVVSVEIEPKYDRV